jgi:CheY-like chemotaxis protein
MAALRQEHSPEGTFEAQSCFDLGTLIEDTVEGVLVGHRFNAPSTLPVAIGTGYPPDESTAGLRYSPISQQPALESQRPLDLILSIDKQTSWNIKSEAGSWRRILINLVGNALKYTESGFIEVSLRTETPIGTSSQTRDPVTLTICDTGRGISKEYLQNHLYTPFAQENMFSPGAGLGLSIVYELASGLGGTVDIQSEVGTGTQVTVTIPVAFAPVPSVEDKVPLQRYEDLTICLLAFDIYPELDMAPTSILSVSSKGAIALKNALTTQAKQWFGMKVVSVQHGASIKANVIVVREDNLGLLEVDDGKGGKSLHVPDGASIIVLCTAFPSLARRWSANSRKVLYLSEPFGPRKMAGALAKCAQQQWSQPAALMASDPRLASRAETATADAVEDPGLRIQGTTSATSSLQPKIFKDAEDHELPVPQPSKITRPYLLLVDDNSVNLRILVTYMTKLKCEHVTATNGLEALEIYRNSTRRFDYVLMDVSMPVMDGFESTRAIRAFEQEKRLPATFIVALTGLGSLDAQQEAFTSGVNLFLTKPVPMNRLKLLIEEGRDIDYA